MNHLCKAELIRVLKEPLAKRIDQKSIENWAASFWSSIITPKPAHQNRASPFTMMFPPPNITGNLHLGHSLTGAIQDALMRQRRMQGYNCTFIPGFDHAGLATQTVLEKLILHDHGISRHDLGEKKFLNIANKWRDEKSSEMRAQLSRLGLSLNYDREYFTMDKKSSQAVHAAFLQLFRAGIIYRETKDVYRSEKLQTTLSDIEVENVDGVCKYVRTGEIVAKRPLRQWFIRTEKMTRKAVELIQNDIIKMLPEGYKRTWSSWLIPHDKSIQDWCISRQSWWGHKIPAYKIRSAEDVTSSWIVADSLEEAEARLGTKDIIQDPDVLDTWFSSSLLPLTLSGWPDSAQFKLSCDAQLFPLNIMETGFDILTFWVSKMVMMSLTLTDTIPFKLVLLHGMMCDSDGKKMSKSTGNVIDPLDVIDGATLEQLQKRTMEMHKAGILDDDKLERVLKNQKKLFPKGIPQCGADGLRAYLLSNDYSEEVVRVQIDQIDKVRRFSNKFWNTFRFTLQIINEFTARGLKIDIGIDMTSPANNHLLDQADQQVFRKLEECIGISSKTFENTYQLHQCYNMLEHFVQIALSQEYIQISKLKLFGKEGTCEEQKCKLQVLVQCLIISTRLLHPFMPHTTEFLYQKLILELGDEYTLKSITDIKSV